MIPSCIQNHPVRYALAFVFVVFFVFVIVIALVWKLAGLRWSTRQGCGWRPETRRAPALPLPLYLYLCLYMSLYWTVNVRLVFLHRGWGRLLLGSTKTSWGSQSNVTI